MGNEEENHEIVIVGGGICGLATALGLHRKGIKSLVLEKSHALRDTGAAISIYLNGWHALDQLGVGVELRKKSILITEIHDVWINKDGLKVTPIRKEGFQCVKRRDLVEALADNLPSKSIRFGIQIVAVEIDPITSFPIIHIEDGSIIRTKVVIGCDGSNSAVAKTLGLKPTKLSGSRVAQGFTNYPDGHKLSPHFLLMRVDKILLGRVPVNEKLVFWFTNQEFHPIDLETRKDPGLIRDQTVKSLKNAPQDVIEMVQRADLSSVSLVRVRYRAPWHLLLSNLFKETVTAAGDAMHPMDPAIGQGGCVALEDAVVLARCLARGMHAGSCRLALKRYETERRMRVLVLSMKSHLIGSLFTASWIKRIIYLAIFDKFLGGRFSHTQFDCGSL